LIVIWIFIFLLIIGVPIVFVLGLTSFSYISISDASSLMIPQRMFVGLDSFVLMAIPFFVLTGGIMNAGGLTTRIVNFCRMIVGYIRGGFALVNVMASMLFAGISGSATADTSAIGSVLIPAMKKDGYDKDFSAAVTAASSCVGPIIPPSIVMVIYGIVAGQSIGALFLGGLIPGILLGLSQMGLCYYYAVKRNYPKLEARISFKNIFKSFFDAIAALIAPIIILGGILSGIFTPTEAGAIAVIYAFIIGFFVYKELKLKDLPRIMIETATTTAAALMIVSTGALFGWVLTYEQIPQMMSELILSISSNKYVILLLINIILLFVGMFMETIASILILTPIFLPIANAAGIDPIHLGVIMVLNLIIGLTTPPVGVCLFIACKIANTTFERLVKAVLPFVAVSIVVLLIVTYFPGTVLYMANIFR